MRRQEALQLFSDCVVGATVRAPDNYPEWDTGGYRFHRADLLSMWEIVRNGTQHDLDKVAFIDDRLAQALASFDRGERQPGQRLMFEIYNLLQTAPLR